MEIFLTMRFVVYTKNRFFTAKSQHFGLLKTNNKGGWVKASFSSHRISLFKITFGLFGTQVNESLIFRVAESGSFLTCFENDLSEVQLFLLSLGS